MRVFLRLAIRRSTTPSGEAGSEDDVGLRSPLHRFNGVEPDDLVARDDATERRARITGERFGVRSGKVTADSSATWIGVLDDRDCGWPTHVVGEAPRRISVEEVQIAERNTGVLLNAIPDAGLVGARR